MPSRNPRPSRSTRSRKTHRRPRHGRLTLERLEFRCLLAADTLASITGVVFNDIDDDGVFDAGSDVPLRNITMTLTKEGDEAFLATQPTDEDGVYRFDDLGVGVYTVTQEPVNGLSQRPAVTQQTVIKSIEDATGRSGRVIDAFETQVAVTATANNTPAFDFVAAPVTEVIGGERELSANLISPQGFADLAVNPSGENPVLQFDSAAASSAERSVIWDGSADEGNPGVDFGLNADLTLGGADALVVRVLFDDLPIDITVRVYSNATDFSDTTISLPGGIFSEPEAFLIPFDQFIDNDDGANFSAVTAIELFHDPAAPAVDMQIDYIGTTGPMRADFPNLELGVLIEKETNGLDADEPTGPIISVGDTAQFTYAVSNTGHAALTITEITDDNGTPVDDTDDFSPAPIDADGVNVGDSNSNGLLDVDEVWQYEASRVVTPGQYTNIAKVTAEEPAGAGTVMADDPSNHFGSLSAIVIQKQTNGEDANEPTGPVITVGDLANFTYAVSNAGNVPLSISSVTDDNGTPEDETDDFSPAPVEVEGVNVGDLNANELLDEDEVWQYAADRIVTAGQYTNIGKVTAFDPRQEMVMADDPSNHFGADPDIVIEKRTNGEDADEPTGPVIPVGELALFTYEVRNTGNMPLAVTSVTDNNGTPGDPSDDFQPDPVEVEGVNVGDTNANGLLDPIEEWLYEASRIATIGQYQNIGTVVAIDAQEVPVTDSDTSHHLGVASGVDIQKLTNGVDADTAPGPLIPVGDEVIFVYEVRNLGNVPLTITSITDDNGTPADPSDDFAPSPIESDGVNAGDVNMNGLLDADEVWLYDHISVAAPGQYTNIGKVVTFSAFEEMFMDDDPSNHFGVMSDIQIEKMTNGEDADTAPGPLVPVGDEVRFMYEVSNLGNGPLSIATVLDDNGTPGNPGDDFNPSPIGVDGINVGDDNANGLLDEDETWLYEATRIATAGQYTNTSKVIAQDVIQRLVEDDDPSNHFGVASEVRIEKLTNGEDADTPTGPLVPVGDEVRFRYEVSNAGNVPLSITDVSDDNGTPGDPSDDFAPSPIESDGVNAGDDNMNGLVDADETWLFEAFRTATAGQYTNIGKVVAFDQFEQMAMDADPSNHFGVLPDPEVRLVKKTNGEDANDEPGVLVFVGSDVRFLYEVSNAAVPPLTITSISDDNGTPGDPSDDFSPSPIETGGFNVGDDNMNGLVDADETWLFEAFRTATAGQYTNIATVVVIAGDEQGDTDSDPSNHFGVDPNPEIRLEKLTNGEDADTSPGPRVPIGDEVRFHYEVSNAAIAALTITSITDNAGTPGDPSDDFSPSPIESGGINVGDDNANGLLDSNETWLYEATGIAMEGQYTNIGTVMAEGLLGTTVTASDPSNHFGFDPEARAEIIVIGNDKGPSSVPLVTTLEPETGEVAGQFLAYEAEYAGGVRVAAGDMDGDGVDEIITAPGKSHIPEIRVFRRGTENDADVWEELTEFRTLAYAADFTGGVNIAVGDVDGDGRNDIVTTPSRGAFDTKVFRNVFGDGDDPIENDPSVQFLAFDPDFISGSVVSLADMNLDGQADIVIGNVGGMRSTVNVFDVSGTPEIIQSFLPFGAEMRGGVSIDLGKINNDDIPDLIVGAGYRGQSAVEVLDGDSGELLGGFTAYDNSNAPVRVAGQGDQIRRITTAQGPNGDTNEIRSFGLMVEEGGLIIVPDPTATLDLNDLNDPRLFGAYYLDLVDLFDLPGSPNGSEPTDGPTDETTTEPEQEREDSGVLAIEAAVDPFSPVPGDSNRDGVFNSSDLVVVFSAGEYEDDISLNSSFETGDWNGDGDFTSSDVVFVFQSGTYGRAARSLQNVTDTSVDLLALDQLFEQDEELWALSELLGDDDENDV